jgi:hypothetical protein
VSVWNDGLVSKLEQPLPAPSLALVDHVVSVQPRALLARLSLVPPTEVTNGELAGNSTPYPESPDETVIATPGWR